MRRIVLVLIIVAVVGLAGYMLLRPKGTAAKKKGAGKAKADTTATEEEGRAKGKSVATTGKGGKASRARGGKSAGSLKPMSKEERKAEKKRLRAEEKRRRRELKRQERERRRMMRAGRRGRGSKRGRKGQYYVVKAIVSLGGESYALIDGRRARVGDIVMGKKVVAIEPDRLEVESFGRRTTVRVGESLMPGGYTGSERRSRRRR